MRYDPIKHRIERMDDDDLNHFIRTAKGTVIMLILCFALIITAGIIGR